MKPHFENYFIDRASLLGEVLFYHLTLEALLTEIIRRSPNAPAESKLGKLMFAKKADECLRLGKLSKELHTAVMALNRVRNKYAHELGFEISFDAALALAKLCGEAGADFTDGVDGCTAAEAKTLGYDTFSLLNETFRNTFFEVACYQGEDEWLEFTS
ncbi:hypothetical protein [Roseateles puraquae]|uniref:DUF4145 domain-containing protein n=1 Tax=Roseateles puraquae TaxID=431059 RepID=A0A254N1T3_9BURK|nr:hypothetical protein [Roseateles puraquae]MDG0853057.1 hypothetical protein [Roseateles puraquae]OWR02176.1 hypothetical protein CDO81_20775 [Roseateles puraquae]